MLVQSNSWLLQEALRGAVWDGKGFLQNSVAIEVLEGIRGPAVPEIILLLANRGHEVEAPSSGL